MRRRTHVLWPLLLAAAVSGCTLLPERPPPPQRHDFGPPLRSTSAVPATVPLSPSQIRISAPGWLDTTEIHYRLLYQDLTRLRAYAYSRWVAPPTALLAQRLRDRLSESARQAGTGGAVYPLQVELTRFEQVFDSPGTARAVVGLRAAILQSGRPLPVAERAFAAEAACAPDVQGAIDGLAALADRMTGEVLAWAAGLPAAEAARKAPSLPSPLPQGGERSEGAGP